MPPGVVLAALDAGVDEVTLRLDALRSYPGIYRYHP